MTPAALLLAAALAAGSPAPPNVLLVTIDTLRPDALGWVAGRNATPALDQLAREGRRFPAAVSPAPVTLPAHASLMTGLLPRRHGVRDNGLLLPATPPTLAETLRRRGYSTAAFVSGLPLARPFGLDRGFELYDDQLPDGPAERRERRAAATTRAAESWLAGARAPWFLWVHYYDPHDPYEPPGGLVRPGPRGDYDGEVAAVDQAFAALRAAAARGRGRLLTVMASDHGESLGEHGEATHGFFVYDSTVAVPLVFHLPDSLAPGESRLPARLVDVAPTVLELVGAPAWPGVDGVSLTALLAGRPQLLPPALIESQRPWRSYGWAPLRALRAGDLKLVEAPRPELYDLRRDPAELRDLAATDRPALERLRGLLARAEAGPVANAVALADPEVAERLRTLGYVGAGPAAQPEAPPRGLADPKDRLADWNLMGEAEAALARGDPRAALTLFERVLAGDPRNRFALSRSGVALLELGQAGAALERLQQAVGAGPEHPESRLDLARAAARLGRHDLAVEQWRELVAQRPREASFWVGLANALGRSGQAAGAVTALEQALRLQPSDGDLRVRLAFALHGAGRASEAAEQLRRAARSAGPAGFAHSGALGLLLARLGRPDEARPWLAAARSSEGDFGDARVQLARLELERGRTEAARQALLEAVAVRPALRAQLAGDAQLAPLLK